MNNAAKTGSLNDRIIQYFPALGFIAGILIWILDACIDHFLMKNEEIFFESLTGHSPSEIWMRTLIIIITTSISFIAKSLMNKQKRTENLLREYQQQLEAKVDERTKELENIAFRDPLTHLLNRRKFSEILENQINRSERYTEPFALLICDIDYFKKINDRYGHQIGDEVLLKFSMYLINNLRNSDSCARWGGEEFIILLPQNNLKEAEITAEKLRKGLENLEIIDEINITISTGITSFSKSDNSNQMVKRADDALYIAKESGRNKVVALE
ncbi:MAG: GGDEF domain-containing protein [Spirochaetia bacterium]|nr:GGDEF domain-containing protein [Spirochaetia bacterium]